MEMESQDISGLVITQKLKAQVGVQFIVLSSPISTRLLVLVVVVPTGQE